MRTHQMKHLLRAHVSQPSLASVNCNFMKPGNYEVTARVKNSVNEVGEKCFVSVQVYEDFFFCDTIISFTESPPNSINNNFLERWLEDLK